MGTLPLSLTALARDLVSQQGSLGSVSWRQQDARCFVSMGRDPKSAGEFDFAEPWHEPRHFSINLILSGTGTYIEWEGNEYPLSPGSLFVRLPGRRHGVRGGAEAREELYLTIAQPVWQALAALGWTPDVPVLSVADPGQVIQAYRTLYHRMLPAVTDDHLAILLAVQEFLLCVRGQGQASAQGVHARALAEACRVMELQWQHSCDPRAVAKQVGLPYEVFRKAFHRRYGCSAREYHQRRRLDHACVLLSTTATSIQDIAGHLGYSDPFAFSARFRAQLGCSPSAYRARRQAPLGQ